MHLDSHSVRVKGLGLDQVSVPAFSPVSRYTTTSKTMAKREQLLSMTDIERHPSPIRSDPLADIDLILSFVDSAGSNHSVARRSDNQIGISQTAGQMHRSGSSQIRQQSCEPTDKLAKKMFSEAPQNSTHQQQCRKSFSDEDHVSDSKIAASKCRRPSRKLPKYRARHSPFRQVPVIADHRERPKRKGTTTMQESL